MRLNPCSRCGGSGQFIVGPIINGVGRSLGVCFRCGGRCSDPNQASVIAAIVKDAAPHCGRNYSDEFGRYRVWLTPQGPVVKAQDKKELREKLKVAIADFRNRQLGL